MSKNRRLILVVSLIAVVAAALLVGIVYLPSIRSTMTTSNTNSTTSSSNRTQIVNDGNASYVANDIWNFTVSINATELNRGQTVQLIATLKNIGSTNQTITYTDPFINPQVSDKNGTAVWAWNPIQAIFVNYTMTKGETFIQAVNIPTSDLSLGHTYNVQVVPLSQDFQKKENLSIELSFSLSAETG